MKLLAPKIVNHFRFGGTCPLGWTLKDEVSTGRATCRCCGKRIAKGEAAKTVWVSFNDNYASYASTKVWLHTNCDHATGEGHIPPEMHGRLVTEPKEA